MVAITALVSAGGVVVAAPLVGLLGIIGVIVAYVKRDEAQGTWVASHLRWLIRTFWYSTLWGVVGRRIAGAPDYAYSDALRSQPGTWDRAKLDRFLTSPQAFAPGVNMTLGGVKNAADRKVVLDFLETLRPGIVPGAVP